MQPIFYTSSLLLADETFHHIQIIIGENTFVLLFSAFSFYGRILGIYGNYMQMKFRLFYNTNHGHRIKTLEFKIKEQQVINTAQNCVDEAEQKGYLNKQPPDRTLSSIVH